MESPQGLQYERNPTHLKRYRQEALPEGDPIEATGESSSSPEHTPTVGFESTNRPARTHSAPKSLADYDVG